MSVIIGKDFLCDIDDLVWSVLTDNRIQTGAHGDIEELPRVTLEELKALLSKMKNGKAADDQGMVIEFLKASEDDLLTILADTFTDIMNGQRGIPEYWRSSTMKIPYKKGPRDNPENYRPICVIPILYKLFTKLVLSRIKHVLDQAQPCDQAGFRSSYSTEDHILTTTLLAEIAHERGMPLWLAVIDFRKAFYMVRQPKLWEALRAQHVPNRYVDLLQDIYSNQRANVMCSTRSTDFEIKRGTRQGRPDFPLFVQCSSTICYGGRGEAMGARPLWCDGGQSGGTKADKFKIR